MSNKPYNPFAFFDPPPIGRAYVPRQEDRWDTWPTSITPEYVRKCMAAAEDGEPSDMFDLIDRIRETDLTLSGIFSTRVTALTGLEWECLADPDAEDENAATKAADYCRDVLRKVADLDGGLSHLALAIGYGVAAAEIVWRVDGKTHRPSALVPIEPSSLCASGTELWELRIRTEETGYAGEPISEYPNKLIVHRPNKIGTSPFRGGALRACLGIACFKRFGLQWFVNFCELYGVPFRWAEFPPNATPEEKDQIIAALRDFSAAAYGAFPKDTNFNLGGVGSGSTSANVIPQTGLIELIDKWYSIYLLGQTLTTQVSDTGGAFAAAKVHDQVRGDILKSDAKLESVMIRRDLLTPMMRFGPLAGSPVPIFRRIIEEPIDVGVALDNIAKAQGVGMTITRGWASEATGIPMLYGESADEPLEKVREPSPFDFGGPPQPAPEQEPKPKAPKVIDDEPMTEDEAKPKPPPKKKAARVAVGKLAIPKPRRLAPVRLLDGWVDEATDRARRQVTAVIDDVRRRIRIGPDAGVLDAEKAAIAIAKVVRELPMEAMTDAVSQYLLACNLAGRVVAQGVTSRTRRAKAKEPNLDQLEAPFTEAIRAMKGKVPMKPDAFLSLSRQARGRAGRVAGVFNTRLVGDIYKAVEKTVETGGTVRDFRLALGTLAEDTGWTGLEPWHAGVVFRQNAAMAFSSGHYEQMVDAEVTRWTFKHYGDSCEQCQPMDGQTFEMSDRELYPPLHFNCDCYASPVLFDRDIGPDGVVASSDIDAPAYRKAQESDSAYRYDPAAFANPDPIRIGTLAPPIREAFGELFDNLGYNVLDR